MLVDSHCHLHLLDLSLYEDGLNTVINNAKQHDVKHLLTVSVHHEAFENVISIAETYEEVTASIGIHPDEQVSKELSVEELIDYGCHAKVVAIGETGLDYYHANGNEYEQQARFRRHIRAAKSLEKPLIIHTRQAAEDTLRILEEEAAHTVGGVMHCFTENWDVASRAMDLNFYISFSGIVTFKNALMLKEVAKRVPLDRMLIETDSPYLAPVPYRGKPNEPAWVKYVVEYIASLRGESYAVIAAHTTKNFFDLMKMR